jgi:AmiR/NasT family two-component response regulator
MPQSTGAEGLNVWIVHPADADGQMLASTLRRAGAQPECVWPAPERWPANMDAAYWLLAGRPRVPPTVSEESDPALIAVLEPGVGELQRLLADCSSHAVLSKPLHPFAILTSLLAARSVARYERRLKGKVRKLEETLRSIRQVEQAKAILMRVRNLGEQEAYDFLRKRAMDRRVPVGSVAAAIIEANEFLTS